ncbi:MAG: TolC family protein [Bacteroidia bacterium]
MKNRISFTFYFLILPISVLLAQNTSITLEYSKELAIKNYPGIKQKALIEQSKNYQINQASMAYLPQISINAQASYQSDVTKLPIDNLPFKVQSLDKDQYRITADINQVLFDGGNTELQKNLQQKQAELEQEKIELELFKVKERVTQIYFSILILNESEKQLNITKTDLESNLKKIQVLKDNGLAFKSNIDQLKAELLKLKQRSTELSATKSAYIQMLSLFMGIELKPETQFIVPEKPISKDLINRPELRIFEKQNDVLLTQNKFSLVKSLPKASLFAQGGYGKPGLNMLKNDFEWFYIGGIRVNWVFSNLYTFGKERKINAINRDLIQIQNENFVLQTQINLKQQAAEINKLKELLETDEELLQLRKDIKKTSEVRMQNGLIGAIEYINDLNQEEISRQNKYIHENQLLMAIYQYQLISGN